MVADMLNKIRELRKALGISQEELAKKCGVSRQTVNAIENNKYDPTPGQPDRSLLIPWDRCDNPPRENFSDWLKDRGALR